MAEPAQRPSFDEFYASAAARLVRYGYALTGDLAEAQDIAQEAFARAWQRWPAVRACDSPEAWVRRVVTNLAASRWRRIRVARNAVGPPRQQHVPEVSTDTVALVSGLRTLPERQRTVLVLYYLGDLSVDQIAAELSCPAGSVKSWLSRGRTALAAAVQVVDPGTELAPAGTVPASTAPASTAPASTVPASTVPASTVPASTVPASTVPASTVPASPVPARPVPGRAAPGRAVPGRAGAERCGGERPRPRAPWPARAEPEASHA